MKTTISILIAILCLTNAFAQKKFKTDSGFVFIDGKYIEPPYVFEIKNDSILYINNEQIYTQIVKPYKPIPKVKHFPGYPDSSYKYISYKDMWNLKVPEKNYTYIGAARDYFYTRFDKDSAYGLLANYIRKLPWVKSYDRDKKGWLLENFLGEKNYYIAFIPSWRYDDFKNPPSKSEYYKRHKNRLVSDINHYLSNLNNNETLFFFKGQRNWVCEWFNTKRLIRFTEILNDSTTYETKLNLFNTEQIWLNSPSSDETKYFIEHFQPNINLQKKIERLNNSNSLLNNNINKNLLIPNNSIINNEAVRATQSTDIAYSPKNGTKYFLCPYTWESAFSNFNVEQTIVTTELSNYNYVTEVPKIDNTNDDIATISLNDYKAAVNSDVIYLACHGDANVVADWLYDGFLFQIFTYDISHTKALNWMQNDPNLTYFDVDLNGDFDYDETWIIADQNWALSNWGSNKISNSSLVFLSSCLGGRNGWVDACGGACFGHKDKRGVSDTQAAFRTEQILQRMNGKINSGATRTAQAAFDDLVSDEGLTNKFSYHQAGDNVTISPAVTDYTLGSLSSSTSGIGYIEFDTWCDASTNPDVTLQLVSGTNVGLGNAAWVNVSGGKSNRIEYSWSSCGPFIANVTVNCANIKSWSDGGTGHPVDFNGDNNPGQSITYTISYDGTKSPQSIDFHADNQYLNIGESTVFHVDGYTGGEFSWTFEGGSPSTSSNASPTIKYNFQGTYDVNLTIDNGGTCSPVSKSDYITVIDDGTSELTLSCSSSGTNPVTVFADGVTGGSGNYTYTFNFSDGFSETSSFPQSLPHTFSNYGNYTCNVSVVDDMDNSLNGSCQESISLPDPDPCGGLNVDFTVNPVTIYENQAYTITNTTTSSQPINYWCWTFLPKVNTQIFPSGDQYQCSNETSNTNGIASYPTYTSDGHYQIQLTVYTDYCVESVTKDFIVENQYQCINNIRINGLYADNSQFNFNSNESFPNNCAFSFELQYYVNSNCALYANEDPPCNIINATNLYWLLDDHILNDSYKYNPQGLNVNDKNYSLTKKLTPGIHTLRVLLWNNHVETDYTGAIIYNCTNNPEYTFSRFSDYFEIVVIDCDYAVNSLNFYTGLYNGNILEYPNNNFISGSFDINGNALWWSILNNQNISFTACTEITLSDGFDSNYANEFTATAKEFTGCNTAKILNTYVVNKCETSETLSERLLNENFLLAYPNPFKDYLTVLYTLKEDNLVNISLYDNSGKKIQTFIHNYKSKGEYSYSYFNQDLPCGTYYLVMQIKDEIKSMKIIRE